MSNMTPIQESSSRAKVSKFKPAILAPSSSRRGLADFSTPGFKAPIQGSTFKAETVSVSSDSSPPTSSRNSIKRHSSAISIPDSPPVKKLKKSLTEPKAVILTSSRVNNATVDLRTRMPAAGPSTGLTTASETTLDRSERCAIKMQNYIAKERMAYQQGLETDGCDILYANIEALLKKHIENIANTRQGNSKNAFACQPIRSSITGRVEERPVETILKENIPPIPISRAATTLPGAGSIHIENDDDYWDNMDDILSENAAPVKPTVRTGDEDQYWDKMDDIVSENVAPAKSVARTNAPAVQNNTTHLRSTPFYSEIKRQLQDIFNLTDFRTNQLEAVTAALEGRDVFVLMPTGGGKSLCYQLPAVCNIGDTERVTVVVSPLVALMKDQVKSLTSKNVYAFQSDAQTSGDDWNRLITNAVKPRLWYVTPEKLVESESVKKILQRLVQENRLARFVIDEAHCISTWGQDFRSAYTSLGSLRDKFPSVPIMALTATANKRCQADIETQLKLRPGHASFMQSFNRTNLKYLVRNKKGNVLNDVVDFIKDRHHGKTGVIYCTARFTCEKVAENLRKHGLNAAHYHAGLPSDEKDQTVASWQNDEVKIIVATIAFGMGIDKADVRYVVHYDMPKSISGYYQETGRAGRDGKPAECLMYYSGSDLHKLRSQIRKTENITPESMKRQEMTVEEVFQFCRKTSVCRRVQLLRHFDEIFDPENCKKGCDVCIDPRQPVSTDVTTEVKSTITLLQQLIEVDEENVTFAQISGILKGSTAKDIMNKNYNKYAEYGCCRKLSKELLDLIFDELLYRKIVTKVSTKNKSGFHNEYLSIGDSANKFLAENKPISLEWHPTPGKEPAKTNYTESISAPPPRPKKGKKKAIDEDPIQDFFDDMYDQDDEPEIINTPIVIASRSMTFNKSAHSTPKVAAEKPASPPVQYDSEDTDPAAALYQKMLTLRQQIMTEKSLSADSVFPDDALQYLSATCPADYAAFQDELVASTFMEGPAAVQLANQKWVAFGQQFLKLCIEHKLRPQLTRVSGTSNATTPIIKPDVLRARYEYQPPAGPSRAPSIPSVHPPRQSKFKPSRLP